MLEIESIHHVSLPVSNLEASKRFYTDILGLKEIDRPRFSFEGAWYQVGGTPDRHLHLILDNKPDKNPTFRVDKSGNGEPRGKRLDSRDIHFAMRVKDFDQALAYLESKGYRQDAVDDFKQLKINRPGPGQPVPFQQMYLLDPDRHVIELNDAPLD